LNTALRARASRTAAALATVTVTALLALGAAARAQALTCQSGYVLGVIGSGAEFCAVKSTGGAAGGGTAIVGGDSWSTVPGQDQRVY